MKKITELSQEEYRVGALHCLDCAKSHLKVAHQAGEIGEYAIGTSILVVSLEELVKGCMLQIRFIDDSIEIKNLENYFKKHSLKHNMVEKMVGSAGTLVVDGLSKIFDENKDNYKFWLALLVGMAGFILISDKKEQSNVEPLDGSLEDIRKAGAYVDFNSETGLFEVPKELYNKEKYTYFKSYVENIFSTTENTLFKVDFYTENKKFIREFVEKLKDENITVTKQA